MNPTPAAGFTPLGKIVSFLLIAGLIGAGVWVFTRSKDRTPKDGQSVKAGAPQQGEPRLPDAQGTGQGDGTPEGMAATQTQVPSLGAPGDYAPKDNTIDVELSEYAGYAGLIVANGGLEPNPNSVFAKKHGFKVRIKLSEAESWPALNAGNMAASATTADVLAVYGKQFGVVVPAQIGYSRGADGVVVRSDIKRVNALKGQTLATAQFTEVDFFIRYLAQEAGLGVNMLSDLNAEPAQDKVNLVFAEEGFGSGDLFLAELKSGRGRLAGCVTWAPKTTEVVEQAGGKAALLTTNRNLLIVADVLIVNRGFARNNPKMVAGLVDGLLEGNRMVRDNAAAHLDVIAKAFKWERADAQEELAKVHLSNLPENLAFFRGNIDAAGSFGGIYQSAVYAYGRELIPDAAPPERFLDLSHLEALDKSGAYEGQTVAIAPLRSEGPAVAVEDNPLLSKDIRFYFSNNSSSLDMANPTNLENLDSIKELLRVSPGSTVLLRGHVDNGLIEEFREKGGESFVMKMSLKAMQLSKDRANEVKKRLAERHATADATRVEAVGRGWNEPISTKSEENMRVEVQWFLVE